MCFISITNMIDERMCTLAVSVCIWDISWLKWRMDMNACNRMVANGVAKKDKATCSSKPCCPDIVSLLGLLLNACVWVTVRWHDTAKQFRQRLCFIFTHIKIISSYSVTSSLGTGRSFSSFTCGKRKSESLKQICISLFVLFTVCHSYK